MSLSHFLASTASIVLVASGPAWAGERVRCFDDANQIQLNYMIEWGLPQPIPLVEMQITDDFALSTDPESSDYTGEFVATGFAGNGVEGADVGWQDNEGRELLVLSFRVGRVFGPKLAKIGGVVSVSGGGLWYIKCRSPSLEQ